MKFNHAEALQAKIYINQKIEQKMQINKDGLEIYGRKIYSQTDEDGILEEIINRINIHSDKMTFIEIGVGAGTENNTLKLLGEGGRGIWVEGNENKYKQCKQLTHNFIRDNELRLINSMVDTSNAFQIVQHSIDFLGSKEPTVLSIDVDGPDHEIVASLLQDNELRPKIIVAEYNGRLSSTSRIVDDYTHCSEETIKTLQPQHIYGSGASLGKWVELLNKYQLVACGILGINAFFVERTEVSEKVFPQKDITNIYNYFDPLPWAAGGYKQMHGFPSKFSIYT